MVYGRWAYVPQGLSQPIDFGARENRIFYVPKPSELEFDGRCFWNGTNGSQEINYWCASEGEDWEQVERNVDPGDYWVVCDYQIIGERTKEATAKKITITPTWTTLAVPEGYLTVSQNGWENSYVSTGWSMSDYIDALVQERFMSPIPNEEEIQRAVMEALHKEDWKDALDQLVPRYISGWEIWWPPYGVRELRCEGVDGRNHVVNLDALEVG